MAFTRLKVMLESGEFVPWGPGMLAMAPPLEMGTWFTRTTVLTAFTSRASLTVAGCLERT